MEQQILQEAYDHLLKLEKIAPNQNTAFTRIHLDFLTDKMKGKGDTEKVEKLEEIRKRMDNAKGLKADVKYFFGRRWSRNAEKEAFFE